MTVREIQAAVLCSSHSQQFNVYTHQWSVQDLFATVVKCTQKRDARLACIDCTSVQGTRMPLSVCIWPAIFCIIPPNYDCVRWLTRALLQPDVSLASWVCIRNVNYAVPGSQPVKFLYGQWKWSGAEQHIDNSLCCVCTIIIYASGVGLFTSVKGVIAEWWRVQLWTCPLESLIFNKLAVQWPTCFCTLWHPLTLNACFLRAKASTFPTQSVSDAYLSLRLRHTDCLCHRHWHLSCFILSGPHWLLLFIHNIPWP